MSFNIIDTIENNAVKTIDEEESSLLKKIASKFDDFEQKMFISNFYCYLNQDPDGFVIDLGNIWQWLGFARKDHAKRLLENNFKENQDYKCVKSNQKKAGSGGHNSISVMMKVRTFKSFCLIADTKKALKIHNYYINMQDTMMEVFTEESNSLKSKLEENKQLIIDNEINKKMEIENSIIKQFPINTECVYLGSFTFECETYYKFGQSNNLKQRLKDHKKTYDEFYLINAYSVSNKIEVENLIKRDELIKKHITCVKINNKNYKEIIKCNDVFNIIKLEEKLNQIIEKRMYSIENFERVCAENDALRNEVEGQRLEIHSHRQKDQIQSNQKIIMDEFEKFESERKRLIKYNDELQKCNNVIQECLDKTNEINETLSDQNESLRKEQMILKEEIQILKTGDAPNHEIASKTDKDPNDNDDIEKWIYDNCIIGRDEEVSTKDIEGWYRIRTQNSNSEVSDKFKEYMNFHFKKEDRLKNPNSPSVINRYTGIKLRDIDNSTFNIEDQNEQDKTFREFIENECEFSPGGKVRMKELSAKYIELNIKEKTNEYILKGKLRDYIRRRKDLFYCNLSVNGLTGIGVYGLSLKGNLDKQIKTSSSAKKVEKVCQQTGEVVKSWKSIGEALLAEGLSRRGMSHAIRDKRLYEVGDKIYFYRS